MEDSWSQIHMQGWGAFVLKEKLKFLKATLRYWNSEVFGDLNISRKSLTLRLNELDIKAESDGLDEEEMTERHKVMVDFSRVSKLNESTYIKNIERGGSKKET